MRRVKKTGPRARPIDVKCPRCGQDVGQPCRRDVGKLFASRHDAHKERRDEMGRPRDHDPRLNYGRVLPVFYD